MAIELFNTLSGVAPLVFAEEGFQAWNRTATLAAKLEVTPGISDVSNWVVSNGIDGGGLVPEGSDVDPAEYSLDDVVKLSLQRSTRRYAFAMTQRELAILDTYDANYASNLVRNRFARAFTTQWTRAARGLEKSLWFGTGTGVSIIDGTTVVPDCVGLKTAILGDGYGKYAGALISANTGLQASVIPGVGNLTLKTMQQLISRIDTASGLLPNFWMCSPNTAVAIQQLISGNTTWFADRAGAPAYELGPDMAPITEGAPVVRVQGIPLYLNNVWEDGYIVCGRFEDMELEYIKYNSYGDAPLENTVDLEEGVGEQIRSRVPVPALTYSVAKTGSSVKFAMEFEVALKIHKLNTFGMLTGVTLPATTR